MKVCFPVNEPAALESEVFGHFGSAPAFLLVDTESDSVEVITNSDRHHAHGMCNPFTAIAGRTVDSVVVGGIGGGALMKLNGAGIEVYRASALTVRENLALYVSGQLPLVKPGGTCSTHSGDCAH